MLPLSRRGLLGSLAASAASPRVTTKATLTSDLVTHPQSGSGTYTSVRTFGATGDGKSDDTHAIRTAIAATPRGGTLFFPPGTYVVSQTIVLRSNSTYLGSNNNASIIQQKDHANLVAVLADENFAESLSTTSGNIQIQDLGIDGNSGANKTGHGIVLMSHRANVRHVMVSNTPESGIVLSDKNLQNRVCKDNAIENRIEDSTVVSPGEYGVWIIDTNSSGRVTDGYLLNNVVANCVGQFAMRIERAAGWFIANNHVYHNSRNGIYLAHLAGTFFSCNEVDKFGLTSTPPASYTGIQVQYAMGRFRPSVFVGNLCATTEGSYPQNSFTYYDLDGDQFGESQIVLLGNSAFNDPVGSHPQAGRAASSIAYTYNTQHGGNLNISDTGTNLGVGTVQNVPKNASVNLAASSSSPGGLPIKSAAAGVGGGAVVAGLGMASLNHQARRQVDTQLAMGRPAPSYRDSIAFIDVAETLNRWEVGSLASAPETGRIHLTYFVPYRPIEVSQIACATGDTASFRARHSSVGVYEVLATGELRLLGASGNRAGELWTAPNALSTVQLDPARGSVPLLLLAGKPYAYAEIQVGGSAATRVGRMGTPALMALEPRASAMYDGYSELPPTLPAPSQANDSGLQLYARLSAVPGEDPGEQSSRRSRYRSDAADDRPRGSDDRPRGSDDRPRGSGDRRRASGDWSGGSDDRPQSSDDRRRASGDRPRAADDWSRASGDRPRASGDRSRPSDDRRGAGTADDWSGASGQRPSGSGDRYGASGDQSSGSGDGYGASGHWSSASGDQSGASGDRYDPLDPDWFGKPGSGTDDTRGPDSRGV
jgi:Pectate lyase superfamily protein